MDDLLLRLTFCRVTKFWLKALSGGIFPLKLSGRAARVELSSYWETEYPILSSSYLIRIKTDHSL